MTSEKKFEKLYCDKSKKYNDLKGNNKELQEEVEFYKNLNTEILETSAKVFALNEALTKINKEYSDLLDKVLKHIQKWYKFDLILTPTFMAAMFLCGYFLGK